MRPVILAQHRTNPEHGLQAILAAAPEITIIGTTAPWPELATLCRTALWDLAVLDVTGSETQASEIVHAIGLERPDLRLIVAGLGPDAREIRLCLRLGARACLLVENVPNELGAAVRAVLAGATYLSRGAAQVLLDDTSF
jgi:DNA-binding NarL/FixJ family response regulator